MFALYVVGKMANFHSGFTEACPTEKVPVTELSGPASILDPLGIVGP